MAGKTKAARETRRGFSLFSAVLLGEPAGFAGVPNPRTRRTPWDGRRDRECLTGRFYFAGAAPRAARCEARALYGLSCFAAAAVYGGPCITVLL